MRVLLTATVKSQVNGQGSMVKGQWSRVNVNSHTHSGARHIMKAARGTNLQQTD